MSSQGKTVGGARRGWHVAAVSVTAVAVGVVLLGSNSAYAQEGAASSARAQPLTAEQEALAVSLFAMGPAQPKPAAGGQPDQPGAPAAPGTVDAVSAMARMMADWQEYRRVDPDGAARFARRLAGAENAATVDAVLAKPAVGPAAETFDGQLQKLLLVMAEAAAKAAIVHYLPAPSTGTGSQQSAGGSTPTRQAQSDARLAAEHNRLRAHYDRIKKELAAAREDSSRWIMAQRTEVVRRGTMRRAADQRAAAEQVRRRPGNAERSDEQAELARDRARMVESASGRSEKQVAVIRPSTDGGVAGGGGHGTSPDTTAANRARGMSQPAETHTPDRKDSRPSGTTGPNNSSSDGAKVRERATGGDKDADANKIADAAQSTKKVKGKVTKEAKVAKDPSK
jgi:hypothetical protein